MLPELLILDISHRCNLSCRICDIWQTGSKEKDMEFSRVVSLLSQAKELGIPSVALSGGEVLLRKDIFHLFDHAASIGINHLGVLTNGILVSQYMDRLKPYLLNNTITPVVSLDSLKDHVHNKIRNSESAWLSTTRGLEALSSLKREHLNVNFNIISIVLNENLEELPALVHHALSLGANSIQFQALLANNLVMSERKSASFWVSPQRLGCLDHVLDELSMLKEKYPGFIRNSVQNFSLMKKYYRGSLGKADVCCLSADKTVLVSNQGTYVTCFSVYGDIEKATLSQVLASGARQKACQGVRQCQHPCLLPCFCD